MVMSVVLLTKRFFETIPLMNGIKLGMVTIRLVLGPGQNGRIIEPNMVLP